MDYTPEELREAFDGEHTDGRILVHACASAWEADRKRLDKLADFIRKSCYKHGGGDDACSCDWLDRALAPD